MYCSSSLSRVNEPEIGDVDESVVEGGEDTGNTEDEFTCEDGGARQSFILPCAIRPSMEWQQSYPRGPGDPRRCSPGRDGWSSWEAC